jgi:hypothetical protein
MMRSTFWFVAATALLACGKDHHARSNVSEPEPVSESDFPQRWQEARHSADQRCCEQAGLTLTESHEEPFGEALASFDSAAAAACLAALEKAPCHLQKEAYAPVSSCQQVYAGTRALGDACFTPWDCAANETQGGYTSCALALGQVEGVCVRRQRRAEGESCAREKERVECNWPLLCDEETEVCVKRPKLGEPCMTGASWGDTCAQGSVCDRMGTKRCVKPKPVGKPCETLEECEDLACVDGLCREPLDVVPICVSE